jgi:hypothetical protein
MFNFRTALVAGADAEGAASSVPSTVDVSHTDLGPETLAQGRATSVTKSVKSVVSIYFSRLTKLF